MGKYHLGRQLTGKVVITNGGGEFGRVVDLNVNELTGEIEDLVVDPNPDNPKIEKLRHEDEYILIPFNSVLAVEDYVVVDERHLA